MSSDTSRDQETEGAKSGLNARSFPKSSPESKRETIISDTSGASSMESDIINRCQLHSKISVRKLEGPDMKAIFDAQFVNNSIWICGWNKNLFAKKTVLFNWKESETSIQVHRKKGDPLAEVPAVMTCFGNNVLFAKNYGNQIFNLDINRLIFGVKYTNMDMALGSMACSKNYLYYIDRVAGQIGVLDGSFRQVKTISTGIKDSAFSDLDLCLIPSDQSFQGKSQKSELSTNDVVVSKSAPNGFIMAINIMGEKLWHLEKSTLISDPNSVSASLTGFIYVADRSQNMVSSKFNFDCSEVGN